MPRPSLLLRALLLFVASVAIAGCKEHRDAFAITGSGTLIQFQTDKPGTIDREVAITGLGAGETVLQIDFRPANGALYGLTSANRICTLDAGSGAATLVSTTPFTGDALNQPVMDFNPPNDFIRVIDYQAAGGSTAILRINPDNGQQIQSDGTVLRFNDSDANDGEVPQLAAIAHSNNAADATATTLYGLDVTTQSLVRITNAGVLTTLGVLDRGFVASAGFDIVRQRGDKAADAGIAYVAIASRSDSARFYEIDLATGNTSGATSGASGSKIGNDLQIRSLAVSLNPPKRQGLY